MKSLNALKAASVIVIATISMQAFAQSNASGVPATTVSGATAKADAKAQRAQNRALQKKIRAVLAKTNGLDVSNIAVRARSGAVVLEGTVPEQAQIDLAGEAAKAVPGVTSLKNALTIKLQGA